VYSPKIAELRSLAVQDSSRGHGYGRRLVEAAVEEAERQKIRQILVVTSTREFFEGLNFGACLNEKYALFWNGTGRG
jgi:amino-acid N-acetyltransferase